MYWYLYNQDGEGKKTTAGSEPTYLSGHVEVDDPLHVGNVESPRHHRGGHQDGGHSLPELGQGLLSLPLENTGGGQSLINKNSYLENYGNMPKYTLFRDFWQISDIKHQSPLSKIGYLERGGGVE